MIILFVLLGLIVLFLLWIWMLYNGLVTAKIRVDEAWSDITVQLKRRYDLIPQLVNTVKAYAKHEKEVFENVTKARTAAMTSLEGGGNPEAVAESENQFAATLKSLFAVSEAYPELKANENFLQLQNELVDTENKIQAARRFYNASVRDYNIKILQFPANLIAGRFGFTKREFFEVENQAEVEAPVEVNFEN